MTATAIFVVVCVFAGVAAISYGAIHRRLYSPWNRQIYTAQTCLFWLGMAGAFGMIAMGFLVAVLRLG